MSEQVKKKMATDEGFYLWKWQDSCSIREPGIRITYLNKWCRSQVKSIGDHLVEDLHWFNDRSQEGALFDIVAGPFDEEQLVRAMMSHYSEDIEIKWLTT